MLLGHCIHLSDREVASMAETGAHPVFCPTSNLFLGSGCFNDQRLREAGVASAIATDIGAGTSYSMLQTLNEGYKILQLQDQKLHALRAFDWITRGNATVLALEHFPINLHRTHRQRSCLRIRLAGIHRPVSRLCPRARRRFAQPPFAAGP